MCPHRFSSTDKETEAGAGDMVGGRNRTQESSSLFSLFALFERHATQLGSNPLVCVIPGSGRMVNGVRSAPRK